MFLRSRPSGIFVSWSRANKLDPRFLHERIFSDSMLSLLLLSPAPIRSISKFLASARHNSFILCQLPYSLNGFGLSHPCWIFLPKGVIIFQQRNFPSPKARTEVSRWHTFTGDDPSVFPDSVTVSSNKSPVSPYSQFFFRFELLLLLSPAMLANTSF